MRMKFSRLFFISAFILAAVVYAAAQEGHPLTGTWYGDFGMTAGQRNDLTVIMKWDGANVSGMVNPGPSVVPIKTARLDVKLGPPPPPPEPGQRGGFGRPTASPATFLVHFEVDAKNKTGSM